MLRIESKNLILTTIYGIFTLVVSTTTCNAHPNDPLSIEEINKTVALTQGKGYSRKKTGTTHAAKEVLLVERHLQKNNINNQRLADIYTYDYERNELIESLVNLSTTEIIQTRRKQDVQLPLTKNEYLRAKRIIFEDPTERKILENEYQRITTQKLTDESVLNLKAFTFTANNLPGKANEASKLCGLHRCAQIMLYTQENIVFEISFIVNLSESVVTQRIGF